MYIRLNLWSRILRKVYFNWFKMWAYLPIILKLARAIHLACALLYFNPELPWRTRALHFLWICPNLAQFLGQKHNFCKKYVCSSWHSCPPVNIFSPLFAAHTFCDLANSLRIFLDALDEKSITNFKSRQY